MSDRGDARLSKLTKHDSLLAYPKTLLQLLGLFDTVATSARLARQTKKVAEAWCSLGYGGIEQARAASSYLGTACLLAPSSSTMRHATVRGALS